MSWSKQAKDWAMFIVFLRGQCLFLNTEFAYTEKIHFKDIYNTRQGPFRQNDLSHLS